MANMLGSIPCSLHEATCLLLQVVVSAIGVPLMHATDGWRYIIVLGMIPSAMQLSGCALVPESPEWLISTGDGPGAKRALTQLRGSGPALQVAWDKLQQEAALKACRHSCCNQWLSYCQPIIAAPSIIVIANKQTATKLPFLESYID